MNKFKRKRIVLGVTQEWLAGLLGVSRSTVTKWESGENMPRVRELIRLAKIFKCPIDDLV